MLDGVRYLRERLADGTGERFEAADRGGWTEEARPPGTTHPSLYKPPTPRPTARADESPSARDAAGDRGSDQFGTVDATDLYDAPARFKGRPVELRNVQCLYAEARRYRCVAVNDGKPVMILGVSVGPESARPVLEADCGTIETLDTPRCTRTIRFVPVEYEEDQPTAQVRRLVMLTRRIDIVPRGR